MSRAHELTTNAIQRIKLYVPRDLAALIRMEVESEPTAAALADRVESARSAWEAGQPSADGRDLLRQEVFGLARRVASERGPDAAHRFFREAAAIGTG